MRLSRFDPLSILLRREARTCKGCKYELTDRAFGQTVKVCTYNQSNNRPKHGRRCKSYQERINGTD